MSFRGGFAAMSRLMNDRNDNQYDSGEDGILPECRSCRFHRPYATEQTCVYRYCPYSLERVSTVRQTPFINPNNIMEVK